jgi:hypothetical protein
MIVSQQLRRLRLRRSVWRSSGFCAATEDAQREAEPDVVTQFSLSACRASVAGRGVSPDLTCVEQPSTPSTLGPERCSSGSLITCRRQEIEVRT